LTTWCSFSQSLQTADRQTDRKQTDRQTDRQTDSRQQTESMLTFVLDHLVQFVTVAADQGIGEAPVVT
jgi:myo-inositol catabolism protein IolC